MSLSETYCVLPFIHFAVRNNGSVRPCCVSGSNLRDSNQKNFSVATSNLSEIWMSEDFENLRRDLLNGKRPDSCSRCWDEERMGIHSKRLRDNEVWKQFTDLKQAAPTPLTIDLKLGNLCNLKCRICNPYASSKFGKEAFDLFQDFDFNRIQKSMEWSNDSDGLFWKSMDRWLSSIEHFDIYGGEPFLSKPHFSLLEKSVREGFSKNQTLHYNTNGTIFPEHMVKEVWPHFKSVNIMFSVDGVGSQFEYQRYPASWETTEQNIKKFMQFDYLKLDVCFTVNAMNIWNFPEFFYWTKKNKLNFWINYLHEPIPFRVQVFTDAAKKRIEARLRKLPKEDWDYDTQIIPLIQFMWDQSFTDSDRQNLMSHLEIYDQHRKQSFKEVFPEVHELLNGRPHLFNFLWPKTLI